MKFWAKSRAGVCVLALSLLLSAAGFFALSVAPNEAFALRVTLKRVIFEGPKRTELLTIVNNTAEEQVYRLGWRVMRMTEDRSLEYVKEGESLEGLKLADDMVRFSPRRVVLPPGGSQQVRLMLRRPKDLADGEYRSHFWIQPEAEAKKFVPDEQKKDDEKPSIQIKMLTGMTVPVFVRAGNLQAEVSITDVKSVPAADGVSVTFTLNRTGDRSTYGSLQIFCADADAPAKEIRGIAVYTEVSKRYMKADVPLPEEGRAACSRVRVKYVADDEDSFFKGRVMAEGVSG